MHQLAMKELRHHEEALAALGEPVETKWCVAGNVYVSGPSGKAQLEIPVKGNRTEGKLFVNATKHMGERKINELVLEIKSSCERIKLLPVASPR